MELKEMCKAVRKSMKLSQRQFAALIGTTQTEISFIEGGFTPPQETKVEKIKKFYKKIGDRL